MSSDRHVDLRASKKRKLKDAIDAQASEGTEPSQRTLKLKPPITNHLLACYLAHEFLSRGTLLGRTFDQHGELTRIDPAKPKPLAEADRNSTEAAAEGHQVYADIYALLKEDGVHLPGIVNPSQLARWIGM